MGRSRALASALLFCSFVVVSVVQSWPLARSLSSSLTGPAGGDTGVYVWNLWVFRHELLQGRSPLVTNTIFVPGPPANLSLHNYTVAADLVALPLLAIVGPVTAFNLVYLLNVALAALGAYFLTRRLWPADPVDRGAAWLAGLLFACSPFLVARSTAHFSLVAAAALPFFVLSVDRAWHSQRKRDAALVGATMAWAAYSDPYYGVYCTLLGLAVAGSYVSRVEFTPEPPRSPFLTPFIDLTIGIAVIVVGVIAMMPTAELRIGPLSISARTLYTPVLFLAALTVVRVWMAVRPRFVWIGGLPVLWRSRLLIAIGAAGILLAPMMVALVERALEVGFDRAPVLWRSSAPGVDLLAFFVPNPNHPLAPAAVVDWMMREPGRFEENVVAIPWTALAIIIAARLVAGQWPSRLWLFITVAAGWLALGPFVRIAGINTFVPTPWTLLRYVPVIGDARMPPRFGILVVMGVAVLFARALVILCGRYPDRRRWLLAGTGLLLAVELLPAPRRLYPSAVPPVYETIAADPRAVSVLDLPVGLLDGLSYLGNYSAASQFYQTTHGKAIVGGYMSRVSEARKAFYLGHPLLGALVQASAGQPVPPTVRELALAAGPAFVAEANLGYVVIDEGRTTSELRSLAVDALRLDETRREGALVLYTPARD